MTPNTHPENNTVVASLIKRLLAMVYDLVLVFALVFCAAMLYAAIAMWISPNSETAIAEVKTNEVVHDIKPIELGWGVGPFCAAVALGFYVFFWKKSGQTLGMRAWKLKLENRTGQPLGIGQLLIRCIVALLSFAFFGLGYWYMFFNANRDTLHDRLSKTWVSMPQKSK